MLLKILVDSTYNNTLHQAVECKRGDLLETGTAYGQSLINAGLAELAVEVGPLVPDSDEPVEAAAEDDTEAPAPDENRKKKSSPRAARTRNVFAPQ